MMKAGETSEAAVAMRRAARKVPCAKCGVVSAPGENRCASCGAHLYIACSDCGSHNPRAARSCSECGRRLHRNVAKKWIKRVMGRPEEFKLWKVGLLLLALALAWGVFRFIGSAPGL